MGNPQIWSMTVCVFLFLSLGSQIHAKKELSLRTTLCINDQNEKGKDLIEKLPGQPHVSFKQYGGYVAVNETAGRFLYYYFAEATKVDESTPLVISFNGGYACSSLLGAFQEHGPFRVQSDGKTLYPNPGSWNNEANMLYVDTPAVVGFSYMNTPSDSEREGDQMTVEDTYIFLVKWLERFPEYKGRAFYISAESYGGHYGPQLAQMILNHNDQTVINLRGIFLGNPRLDELIEDKANDEYLVKRALVPQELMDERDLNCNSATLNKDKCSEVSENLATLKQFVNEYNIYAPVCLNSTLTNKPKEKTIGGEIDPCTKYFVKAYLNLAAVQEAMHANTTKLPYPWEECNNKHRQSWPQKDKSASMVPILQNIMGKGIRTLVYNGDLDSVVSMTATMSVLKTMNLTVEKRWRMWYCETQVGGFIEEYKGNFTYATVREAGHMVPSDQPMRALTLFTSFIRNIPLPKL